MSGYSKKFIYRKRPFLNHKCIHNDCVGLCHSRFPSPFNPLSENSVKHIAFILSNGSKKVSIRFHPYSKLAYEPAERTKSLSWPYRKKLLLSYCHCWELGLSDFEVIFNLWQFVQDEMTISELATDVE